MKQRCSSSLYTIAHRPGQPRVGQSICAPDAAEGYLSRILFKSRPTFLTLRLLRRTLRGPEHLQNASRAFLSDCVPCVLSLRYLDLSYLGLAQGYYGVVGSKDQKHPLC